MSFHFLWPLLSFSLLFPQSLLLHNVISHSLQHLAFWSYCWSYYLYQPLCASNGQFRLSFMFHSDDVPSPFPFRFCYIFNYVCQCHSGSLPIDGIMDSDFLFDIYFYHFPFHLFEIIILFYHSVSFDWFNDCLKMIDCQVTFSEASLFSWLAFISSRGFPFIFVISVWTVCTCGKVDW